jgi:hypothetical protein
LAVVLFADLAAVLPGDADRVFAFLSEELAHNGLASARQEGRVPRPLVPGLRGLCDS